MTRVILLIYGLLTATVTVLGVGCAKTTDATHTSNVSSSAPSRAKASSRLSATLRPIAAHTPRFTAPAGRTTVRTSDGTTVGDKTVTYAKHGETASLGTGTSADLVAVGLPIYPAIAPGRSSVIKHATKHEVAVTIFTDVADPIASVDAWYARKLDAGFKVSRVAMPGMRLTNFIKSGTAANESVLLQATKDRATGKPITSITLLVRKKS